MINLSCKKLVMPYFVIEGRKKKEPVLNMPGVKRLSVDSLLKEVGQVKKLGIGKVLLFGICPEGHKDAAGSYACSQNSIIAQAIRELKRNFKGLTVITDVCLCAYTNHGHCGILRSKKSKVKSQNGVTIDNPATLKALGKIALSHAEAGADWVAPSAMAKGQVKAMRRALDENGFRKTKILGYSAKFASNFYGPFRAAAQCAPRFGDRSAYQLDYSGAKSALKEIEADINEGADMVMVKPALSYLDIVREGKSKFRFPLAAYNVSGEYSLVKLGVKNGLWDEKKAVDEIISSIFRAGADLVITYHAKDIARWLR